MTSASSSRAGTGRSGRNKKWRNAESEEQQQQEETTTKYEISSPEGYTGSLFRSPRVVLRSVLTVFTDRGLSEARRWFSVREYAFRTSYILGWYREGGGEADAVGELEWDYVHARSVTGTVSDLFFQRC